MDNEPIEGQEKSPVPNQEILRDIFDRVGQLSEKGEESFAGRIIAKDYTLSQIEGWDNLTKIFVAQKTEKGKREIPTTQDGDVVFYYKEGELVQVDYRFYKESDIYRIEKEEDFKREGVQPPVENFPSIRRSYKSKRGSKFRKETGIYKCNH